MRMRHSQTVWSWILVAGLAILACDLGSPANPPGKPQVIVQAPASGSQFREGDEVAVQSTATDRSGIARVELLLDGVIVGTDAPPAGQPPASFTIIQRWKATAGAHTIGVRAYNASGAASDPAVVSITVQASTAQAPATLPPKTELFAPVPSTTVPTPTLSPTPNIKDALLAAFSTALGKVKTYRVKVAAEQRLIEVVLPDRFHQLESANWFMIGTTLYRSKEEDVPNTGQVRLIWSKQEVPGSVSFFDKVNLAWYPGQIAHSPQSTLLDPRTIDDTPCVGYLTSIPLDKKPVPAKIWFATQDGLPRQIELGESGEVVIVFYDWNAPIEINAPI